MKKHSKMKMRESVKYAISFGIVATGIVGMLVLKSFQKPPATRESTSLVPQVEVQEVVGFAGQLDMEVTGTVVPFREIRVAAEVAGRVTNKTAACEAGQFVSKGELLLEIDPEEYRLDIATREADVEQAKRRMEENLQLIEGEKRNIELAKADLKLQQAELKRNQRLRDALSKSEVDRVRRSVIAAQSALTLRRNNLGSLEAAAGRLDAAMQLSRRQLEKAELNLRRATVVAPEDGVIVNEMVQEGDFVARGTQLLTFEDTRQAEVLCNLTMPELNQIRKNAAKDDSVDAESTPGDLRSVYRLPRTPVTIRDPANPEVSWNGMLERFDGIGVDDVTKTIPCRIAVQEPIATTVSGTYALVRGMFVRCLLEFHASGGDDSQGYLSIPEQAVHPNRHVWVVQDDRLKRKPIRVVDYVAQDSDSGDAGGRLAIVERTTEGPAMGDRVVVSPLSQPSENAAVEVANQAEAKTKVDANAEEVNVSRAGNTEGASR